MRNRHLPRLCGSCARPMAVQEDACWSCDARWGADEAPRTPLVLLASDDDRWMNDGGYAGNAAVLAAVGS